MWKERLEEIRKEKISYNEKVNNGISQEEAVAFVKKAEAELNVSLPDAYIEALKHCNGIEFNGISFYGADEQLLSHTPEQPVNGFIEHNQIWYENEWQKQYIFFGDGDISWYVYDLKKKIYLELDKPSGEECEEFDSFDDLLEQMLDTALE